MLCSNSYLKKGELRSFKFFILQHKGFPSMVTKLTGKGGDTVKSNIRQIMRGEIIVNGKKDKAETEIIFITLVICSKIGKCQTEPHLL